MAAQEPVFFIAPARAKRSGVRLARVDPVRRRANAPAEPFSDLSGAVSSSSSSPHLEASGSFLGSDSLAAGAAAASGFAESEFAISTFERSRCDDLCAPLNTHASGHGC